MNKYVLLIPFFGGVFYGCALLVGLDGIFGNFVREMIFGKINYLVFVGTSLVLFALMIASNKWHACKKRAHQLVTFLFTGTIASYFGLAIWNFGLNARLDAFIFLVASLAMYIFYFFFLQITKTPNP